jgi:hypothetical protein
MTQLLLVLSAIFSAAPAFAAVACSLTPDGYCTNRTVNLSLKRGEDAQLNVSLGYSDTLKVVAPNGTVFTKKLVISTSAFKHRFEKPKASVLYLFARPPAQSNATAIGQQANVRMFVAGQIISLNLKVVPNSAVQKIVLDFPQLEAERADEAKLRAQIRAEIETELAQARANLGQNSRRLAEDQVIDAALKRLKCAKAPARGLDGYLRLTTRRICEFGDWIFVEAVLDNIKRNTFELGEISASGIWDDAGRPLDFKVKWVIAGTENTPAALPLKLGFKDAVRGMFLLKPPTDQPLPDSYSITVQERGGQKRSVTAEDIEF